MRKVTVTAAKPLDIRNPNFDEKQPISVSNPVSIPIAKGETFEMEADGVSFQVKAGAIEDPSARNVIAAEA